MKLSLPYLTERHHYWKEKLGEAGIWNPELFKDVTIVIRPACKSYNGLFIRRYLKVEGKRRLVDRIFIYNKVEDFEPHFLDSILVHEMIHQYIIQNRLKDSSSHGPLFRSFMHRINEAFPQELKINITDNNPSLPPSPPEIKTHILLILHLDSGFSYCCVINPTKTSFFQQMIRRNLKKWKVKEYYWATSSDPFFNPYSRCTRTLHGIKHPSSEFPSFLSSHYIEPCPLN